MNKLNNITRQHEPENDLHLQDSVNDPTSSSILENESLNNRREDLPMEKPRIKAYNAVMRHYALSLLKKGIKPKMQKLSCG